MGGVERFRVEVPQATLDDLAERLAASAGRVDWRGPAGRTAPTWPSWPTWSAGGGPALTGGPKEAAINRFPQFRATEDLRAFFRPCADPAPGHDRGPAGRTVVWCTAPARRTEHEES